MAPICSSKVADEGAVLYVHMAGGLTQLKRRMKREKVALKGLLVFFVVVVFVLFCFVFVFLPFLGPLPLHMEVPRLGVKSEP